MHTTTKTGYVFIKDGLYFWWDRGTSACDYGFTPNIDDAFFVTEERLNWYRNYVGDKWQDWMIIEGLHINDGTIQFGRCKRFIDDAKLTKVFIKTTVETDYECNN